MAPGDLAGEGRGDFWKEGRRSEEQDDEARVFAREEKGEAGSGRKFFIFFLDTEKKKLRVIQGVLSRPGEMGRHDPARPAPIKRVCTAWPTEAHL